MTSSGMIKIPFSKSPKLFEWSMENAVKTLNRKIQIKKGKKC